MKKKITNQSQLNPASWARKKIKNLNTNEPAEAYKPQLNPPYHSS
jgi:hypothetical protein